MLYISQAVDLVSLRNYTAIKGPSLFDCIISSNKDHQSFACKIQNCCPLVLLIDSRKVGLCLGLTKQAWIYKYQFFSDSLLFSF